MSSYRGTYLKNAHYEPDSVGTEEDDGTMPANLRELASHVIGHKIVSVEKGEVPHRWYSDAYLAGLIITLDNGKKVGLADTDGCCADTELESFLLNPEKVDHIITGVQSTEGYHIWHIYADAGDVLKLTVGWSCGNPFYYGYGFDIEVVDA